MPARFLSGLLTELIEESDFELPEISDIKMLACIRQGFGGSFSVTVSQSSTTPEMEL